MMKPAPARTFAGTAPRPAPPWWLADGRIIALLAAVASTLLSLWLIARTDTINKDGILYLRMAQLMQAGDWQGALQLYDMPLLSMLVLGISTVTTLSLSHSAYLLMALLYGAIAATVVRLVAAVGGGARHQWIVFFALLSHQTLSQYRDIIIRDPGAWLFSLLAVLGLLAWLQHQRLRFLYGFVAAVLVAAFFRLETLTLFLLLPLHAARLGNMTPARWLLVIVLLLATCVAVGSIFFSIHGKQLWEGLHAQIYWREFTAIGSKFEKARSTIASSILLTNSSPQITAVTIAVYVVALLCTLIEVAGPLLCAIMAWCAVGTRGLLADQPVSRHFLRTLRAVVVIGVSYLSVLLLTMQFLVPRYAMFIGLMVLVCFPFIVTRLIDHAAGERQRRLRRWAVAIVLLLGMLDGVISIAPGKYNARDAGIWISEQLPAGQRLLTNSHHIGWRGGMQVDWKLIDRLDRELDPITLIRELGNHDYYALLIKRQNLPYANVAASLYGLQQVRVFDEHPGNIVLVLRIARDSQQPMTH